MLHLYVSLQNAVARLREEQDGATAVEYGLLVTLIAVAIITIVTTLGTDLAARFAEVVEAV